MALEGARPRKALPVGCTVRIFLGGSREPGKQGSRGRYLVMVGFRKVNQRVGCVDGLVQGEHGGKRTCGEMLSVVQITVAGDAMTTSLRKGDACQGHSGARTEGLGDHGEGGEKIPGSLAMTTMEVRHEFPWRFSVFCLRCWQVIQVAHVQEATENGAGM